jgi:hypothetical protein
MDIPEKLAALGTQDKGLKQTNKNKTQYVLDTISKESSRNILSRPIVCYYFPHIIVVALACPLKAISFIYTIVPCIYLFVTPHFVIPNQIRSFHSDICL